MGFVLGAQLAKQMSHSTPRKVESRPHKTWRSSNQAAICKFLNHRSCVHLVHLEPRTQFTMYYLSSLLFLM